MSPFSKGHGDSRYKPRLIEQDPLGVPLTWDGWAVQTAESPTCARRSLVSGAALLVGEACRCGHGIGKCHLGWFGVASINQTSTTQKGNTVALRMLSCPKKMNYIPTRVNIALFCRVIQRRFRRLTNSAGKGCLAN